MKIKNMFLAVLVILTFSGVIGNIYAQPKMEDHNTGSMDKIPAEKFHADMRKLWEDHIVWTRNVILCLVDNLPGTNESVDRLLKNQEDIGNAIKPFYGNEAGDKLTTLLKSHITIAADLVTAAKKGDKAGLNDASQKWNANADEIASFLSSAIPNLKLNDLKMMMNEHLKLTTDEAVARIKKDYAADITAYDKVHGEILMMADDLSNGIIRQLPDKFN